jgi:hypothetical protein
MEITLLAPGWIARYTEGTCHEVSAGLVPVKQVEEFNKRHQLLTLAEKDFNAWTPCQFRLVRTKVRTRNAPGH